LRILVTGAGGFVGKHLLDLLAKQAEAEIFGLDIFSAKHQVDSKIINIDACNLLNKKNVYDKLSSIKPDLIFHLAAMASVADAWKSPEKVVNNNTICQLNLLEGLRKLRLKPRVLIVSTGEVYGAVSTKDLPISETSALKPNNPYSVSKVAQEFLGLQYFESFGIPVIISRSFNHTGPGQKGDFVVPAFSRQVVDIEQNGLRPVILVGNLETDRDFLDVRDVVKAYWLLANKGVAGQIYNVCSRKTVKIKQILDLLLSNALKKINVKKDPARYRPSDAPLVVGDNSKLKEATGWEPEIAFDKTIVDALGSMRITSAIAGSVATKQSIT